MNHDKPFIGKTYHIHFYPYEVRDTLKNAVFQVAIERSEGDISKEALEFDKLAKEFKKLEVWMLSMSKLSCDRNDKGEIVDLYLEPKFEFHDTGEDVALYKKIWPSMHALAVVLSERYLNRH